MNQSYCFRLLLAAAGALGLMCVGVPSFAADEQVNSPALEEIVVTAQKRQESLETVPIAATVYTSETRDLVGMESVQDLTNYTPGITYNHQLDRMFVRGVGRSSNNLSIDPAVATYLDGFYSSFNRVGDSSSLFIAQEEIYRGPQGTLFGRNAIGGAFNVSSPRPTTEWEGEGRVRFGNYDYKDIEGTVSGPITDFLRFRAIAGEYKQDQGYFQSIYGHQYDGYGLINDQEYQIQLAGNVTDKFEWWGKIDHHHWNNGYGTFQQITPYVSNCDGAFALGGSPLTCGGLIPNPAYNSSQVLAPANPQNPLVNPSSLGGLRTPNDTENRERLKDDESGVLTGVGHLGFADIKYEGGYYSYEYDLVTDNDNSGRDSFVYSAPGEAAIGVPANNVLINTAQYFRYSEIKHYYTNEIDLVSTTDSPLQWVAGFFQYHEKFRWPIGIGTIVPQPQLLNPVAYIPPLFNTPTTPNPSGESYSTDQHTTSQSWAVFEQTDWKFAETLKATLGLRYNSDRRASEDMARYIYWDPTLLGQYQPAINLPFGGGTTFNPATGFWERHLAIASHATTGTAAIEWQPSNDQLGYLKYSRGYKDSGINSGGAIAAVPYTKPEFVDAYEVGWKQTINRAFEINSSVFYYKYKDAQLPFPVLGAGPTTTEFFNVNEKIYGLELESLWQASTNLSFILDYSYLHGAFTSHDEYNDAYNNEQTSVYGNQVPGSPKNKFAFNAIYTWHFTPGSFAMSGSYVWRDRVTSSAFKDPIFYAGSYGENDFRGTWTAATNRWSVFGYIKNAFNVRGSDDVALSGVINSPSPAYAGYATVIRSIVPPRTFGMEFRVKFGAKVHE